MVELGQVASKGKPELNSTTDLTFSQAASANQDVPPPRPLDAIEFSNLLNSPSGQQSSVAASTSVDSSKGINSALPIVDGIQSASNHLKNRMGTIRELTSKSNFTGGAADLLRMQLELVQLGFEIELTGKVVTRATQDIDQLSKLQ